MTKGLVCSILTVDNMKPTELAIKVKEQRSSQGYSIRGLANAIGVTHSYLSQWESGKLAYEPAPDKIRLMEHTLGVTDGQWVIASTSGGGAILGKVLKNNSEHTNLVLCFLDQASKIKVPAKKWSMFSEELRRGR